MSFLESPRFPERISYGAVGGPGFSTDVVTVRSGRESRTVAWAQARARYDVEHGAKTQAETDALVDFFRRVRGRAYGFRFKDWADFQASGQGLVASVGGVLVGGYAVGHGEPVYQLVKRYGSGSYVEDRSIGKPVAGTVSVTRAGSGVAFGASAGQIALATTTGLVTFVADQQIGITSHTVGAAHQIIVASAFTTQFVVGGRIYVTGVTGTAAAVLNNRSHEITVVAGQTYTLATNTAGLTATGGSALRYPQPNQALLWSGEFDVPCRFDSDEARIAIIDRSASGGLLYQWSGIPIVEIRP